MMRVALLGIGALAVFLCALTPGRAEPAGPIQEGQASLPDLNSFSDACASAAAFVIAPQVFLEGDGKNLPDWIRICNSHPDKGMCTDTIKIISENQKDVPSDLKCE